MPATTNRKMSPVSITRVVIDDGFWSPRIETNRVVTIPHEYRQCKETGRIDAFDLTWRPGVEPVPHYFWDSDVAKWIEAASYSLATRPDPELDRLLDEVIEKIAKAQQPDGYLNVYFTVVEPEKRWKNLGMWHELYCAGHLIEAAVAHYEATGQRRLLDVMCRYADYIASVFGPDPGQRYGAPGHEEIELALVKLYRVTGNRKYLELSKFFIDQRGQKPSVFQRELEHLSDEDSRLNRYFFDKNGFDTSYCQDHLPVREQSEAVGHAVRAMYLYCGMADVAVETGDEALLRACRRLWNDVVNKKMYITGGVGSSRLNEGFTQAYDLPNKDAYAETCAAIALIFWSQRMLQIEADSRYADIMERALYNGALSGISLDGQKFFYVNPLASDGGHHRQEWFGCACCPPNIARLIASLGSYIYSESAEDLYVHLYISGHADLNIAGTSVRISQRSDYPWDGDIQIEVEPDKAAEFGLNLRIPGWCRKASLALNGAEMDISSICNAGYVRIHRKWQPGDMVRLNLDMPVERVVAHPNVAENLGHVALSRGPIVFCLEEADNPVPLQRIILPRDAKLTAVFDEQLLGGVVKIQGEALLIDDTDWGDELYRFNPTAVRPYSFTAVPYYAWDHRTPGQMRVWIRSL